MKHLSWFASCLLCAACGDNLTGPAGDAGPTDGGLDAASYVPPTPFAIPLAVAGPDQLMSAVAGPNGTFYAAGFAASTLTGARLITVVKLTSTGALDPTFGGGDGIATTTFEFAGGADEIDLAVQGTGKLIVSATVADEDDPADRDVLVFRLDAAGALDPVFGVGGSRRLDLGTAYDSGGTLTAVDGARGLALGPDDGIFIHAVTRGADSGGPRDDTDFAVVKLDAIGTLDILWAGLDGIHLLDIQASNAAPRGVVALADGSVIASGYANSPGVGTTQPVLYKLTEAGVLDQGFADGGLFHETVLAVQTEIYNVAVHGSHLITGGYGRASGDKNDWVSMKFDVASGDRDLAWGTTSGAVVLDPSGIMAGSNCRNAIALPGGSTLLLGSFGAASTTAQDAAFAVLDVAGALDAAFGDGVHGYQLGGNDQFWGGAVSGDHALIVGWKGGGATPTATSNDDAYAVLLPLPQPLP